MTGSRPRRGRWWPATSRWTSSTPSAATTRPRTWTRSRTYELLLVWSVRAGASARSRRIDLHRRARRRPAEADEAMARAQAHYAGRCTPSSATSLRRNRSSRRGPRCDPCWPTRSTRAEPTRRRRSAHLELGRRHRPRRAAASRGARRREPRHEPSGGAAAPVRPVPVAVPRPVEEPRTALVRHAHVRDGPEGGTSGRAATGVLTGVRGSLQRPRRERGTDGDDASSDRAAPRRTPGSCRAGSGRSPRRHLRRHGSSTRTSRQPCRSPPCRRRRARRGSVRRTPVPNRRPTAPATAPAAPAPPAATTPDRAWRRRRARGTQSSPVVRRSDAPRGVTAPHSPYRRPASGSGTGRRRPR